MRLMFHLYGVHREDAAERYIMDTFPIVKRQDETTRRTAS